MTERNDHNLPHGISTPSELSPFRPRKQQRQSSLDNASTRAYPRDYDYPTIPLSLAALLRRSYARRAGSRLPVVMTSDPYHRNLPGETVAPKLSEHLFGVKTRHLQGTNLFLCRWTPGRA